MIIRSAYYSIYSNEQWGYKDAIGSSSIDRKLMKTYKQKVLYGGFYFNPTTHDIFISSGVVPRKGETPSIKLDSDDLIIGDEADGNPIEYYGKNYIVDFIYSNNDEFINSLQDDMKPIGKYIRDGKAVQKQAILYDNKELLRYIFDAKLTNIVCAIVDAILSGKSVVLYGQIQDRKDLLNILFYSLRCLPPKLANSIIINTNIKNGNIEKEQFIGYMTNCMNADGVDFISISDCEKAEYKPSHFYTMYLEWLIGIKGVINFDETCFSGEHEIEKQLNVMAINNLELESEKGSGKVRIEQLQAIVKLMSNNDILSIIEEKNLTDARRALLEKCIREIDSLKYIYICNATQLRENIDSAKFIMNESTTAVTITDFLEIEKFYKEYSLEIEALEFVKTAFLQCVSKVKEYDEKVFELVYRLKIYLNVDMGEMGFVFVDKTHSKYNELDRIKEGESNLNVKTNESIININKRQTAKWFFQSSSFASAVSLIIPILIGAMLISVPEKVWKYFAVIMNVNTWYVMPVVLIVALALAFAFYLIPYFIMRKNTVHLNGFSNIDSTGVSCICMLAVLIPIIIFVVFSATV